MRGVVFLGGRKLELREYPDPTPGPGEVVVAMKASGMCGSDLHPYRAVGNAAAALGLGGGGGPVVAGHEPCGVVAARGAGVSEADAPTGQRVMVHHYKGCGRCKNCKVGWAQLCRQGIVVYGMTGHGGHAAYMTVPAYTLVPLPDSLSSVGIRLNNNPDWTLVRSLIEDSYRLTAPKRLAAQLHSRCWKWRLAKIRARVDNR